MPYPKLSYMKSRTFLLNILSGIFIPTLTLATMAQTADAQTVAMEGDTISQQVALAPYPDMKETSKWLILQQTKLSETQQRCFRGLWERQSLDIHFEVQQNPNRPKQLYARHAELSKLMARHRQEWDYFESYFSNARQTLLAWQNVLIENQESTKPQHETADILLDRVEHISRALLNCPYVRD